MRFAFVTAFVAALAIGVGVLAGRSPGMALLLVLGTLGLMLSIEHPELAVLGLIAYLPFEGWLLKFVPDGSY
ncbi:MAG: hypothetical protein L6413_04340, partial [Coriobacteriia bacterium]|nr:hypothetical protein [Coriobacteriia bacterium]